MKHHLQQPAHSADKLRLTCYCARVKNAVVSTQQWVCSGDVMQLTACHAKMKISSSSAGAQRRHGATYDLSRKAVGKPSSELGTQWRGSATYFLLHASESTVISRGRTVGLTNCCMRVKTLSSAEGTQQRGSETYFLLHEGEKTVISSVHAVERRCDLLPVARG